VDRTALGVWLITRAGLLLLSLYSRYATSSGRSSSWLGLFQHWDWYRYLTVAEYGYTSGKGPAYDENITAFLPGYPLTLRFVHFFVRDWAVSGLLISFVAGGVAVVALARLTEFEYLRRHPDGSEEQTRRAARTAVLLLVCAPAAVFLAVGYTEALFLAFAVPAWLAARRGQWVRAGILLAFACTVRINGLFVLAGIGVMFLASRPTKRDWVRSPALLLPVASVGAYCAYLKDITGDWLDWLHAEKRGWDRSFTNPISSWKTSWNNAFGSGFGGGGGGGGGNFGGNSGQRTGGGPSGGGFGGNGGGFPGGGSGNGPTTQQSFGGGVSSTTGTGHGGGGALAGVGTFDSWAFRLELLAVIVGVATVLWLGWRRRWAELTYVGISVFTLATSTYYQSIPREMLLWWPLWIGAAIWLAARRWATIAVLSVSGSLMVGVALLYFSGQWAG
jgi:Gpi18-like mannosyltransferase